MKTQETIKKHAIKIQIGTIVSVIIFCVTCAIRTVNKYNLVVNEAEKNNIWILHILTEIVDYDKRISIVEKSTIRVETDLAWIKNALIQMQHTLDKW